MRSWAAVGIAAIALGGARVAREAGASMRPADVVEEPYAPSVTSAPFVSLGYHELAADVLWVRLLGYFGGSEDATATGIGDLVQAIVALDPQYHRIYEYGARAMTLAPLEVTQETYEKALAVLDRGMAEFKDDWRLPDLAGEIYAQDLQTKDPAQRRVWDEKAVMLTESAMRKPGAPATAATWAAEMRGRLGQQERAIKNLREMVLLTSDASARKRMLDKLTKMMDANHDEIAAELYAQKHLFDAAWQRDRPALPPNMYVVVGARLPAAFDMTDLATGGHDLATAAGSATSESDPSSL